MRRRETTDVLEPEKCPLPREVGPFFPLLTGGENIYKTNRAHITSESTDSRTGLSRNISAVGLSRASFQNTKLTVVLCDKCVSFSNNKMGFSFKKMDLKGWDWVQSKCRFVRVKEISSG